MDKKKKTHQSKANHSKNHRSESRMGHSTGSGSNSGSKSRPESKSKSESKFSPRSPHGHGNPSQKPNKSSARRTHSSQAHAHYNNNGSQNQSNNHVRTRTHAKDEDSPSLIWGRHATESFLKGLDPKKKHTESKYILHVISATQQQVPIQLSPIVELCHGLGIQIKFHSSEQDPDWPLANPAGDINHQRVCLNIPEYPLKDIEDAFRAIEESEQNQASGCIGLVLDQIQDPRNFGAILRSAAFFNVKFVIFGKDRQSKVSPLVFKSSAGGAFFVDLIPVVNINRALQQLKDKGAWTIGAATDKSAISLAKVPRDRNWVVVLGNESNGLRSEVKQNCDFLVSISGGQGHLESLNVSVACGIFTHSLSSESNRPE